LNRPRSRRLAFVAATASLVAVFAASGSPIPLYERYRVEDGLSTLDLSIAAVSYFVAVMFALIVFGRISNHLGRKPVSLGAVGLAAAGCLVLLEVSGLPVLAAGRILQGLACGLGSSAIAAYIVDAAPEEPAWLAAATSAGAPLIGLTVGALGAGSLAQYGPAPAQTPYVAAIVLLGVCAILLMLSSDPVPRAPGAVRSMLPRVLVPSSIRPLLPAAIAVFCSTWALGGFYQAFGPTISAENLGTTNTLVAAIVFSSFMAPYAFGGPLTGRLDPLVAQRTGIVAFAGAAIGIVIGLGIGSVVLVIACSILAGTSQGAAFTGTMRALLARVVLAERAGLMSTVYLFSYSGAAIPSLISGRLSSSIALSQIALGYAALAVGAVFIVLTTAWRSP
jgi:MFS family permease